ncbi:GNAT family N-acetyltransferase [Nocardioides campestrisoli]|uniref:GNAT family N-acetyltransferase n=1 Tax=Nocardioides campestrisoli TaxID=2736757 RepID=UPI00163DA1E3|nr:GNAT family N-acetyltransferase [Nocardioides campestrisoli]
MSEETQQAQVRDNPDESRYEVHLDGELAGFAEYEFDDKLVDFTHTEVFEQFSGKGLAQQLAAESLDDVRSRGLQALPHCAFYAKYLAKNPEYVDLVPADRRAEFDLA